jgi:hypothetical protein
MADTKGKQRYARVSIDDVDYAGDVHTAEMPAAESNVETYTVLAPAGQVVDEGTPAYTFHLVGLQGSTLYAALVAAEGTVTDVEFQAEAGVGKTTRAFSIFVPTGCMPLGGEEGSWREFDVTFNVQGDVTTSVSVA